MLSYYIVINLWGRNCFHKMMTLRLREVSNCLMIKEKANFDINAEWQERSGKFNIFAILSLKINSIQYCKYLLKTSRNEAMLQVSLLSSS